MTQTELNSNLLFLNADMSSVGASGFLLRYHHLLRNPKSDAATC